MTAHLKTYWKLTSHDNRIDKIRAATRLNNPEDANAIEAILLQEGCCIWHAASIYYNTKCNCYECGGVVNDRYTKRPRPAVS